MKPLIVDLFNSETVQVQNMDSALRQIRSVIVTDSTNLWDSVMKVESCGLQLGKRHLAVEILSYREGLHAAGIECRWIGSDYQLADALSKVLSYEAPLNVCQQTRIFLFFDPNALLRGRTKGHAEYSATFATKS